MHEDSIIDLTTKEQLTPITDSDIECTSSEFENETIQIHNESLLGRKSKKRMEQEDFSLAQSLQIAEERNAAKEIESLKMKRESRKRSTMERFFKPTNKGGDKDVEVIDEDIHIQTKKRRAKRIGAENEYQRAMELNKQFLHNVLSSELELLDPTPNIELLFELFNKAFFYDSLKYIDVKWSKRMTLCAGICRMKKLNVTISLSQPLLSYRGRSDTVNTLLHEMIHAYLFVTYSFDNHNDHGKQFQRHMKRINAEGNAQITVYHTFIDEVNHCKKWWWRCDGKCREQPPYFGYVKRSMNRPPQPADYWYSHHQETCGGAFHLVKSPLYLC